MPPTLRADLDVSLQKFQEGMGEALDIAQKRTTEIEKLFADLNPKASTKFLVGTAGTLLAGFGLEKAVELITDMNRQMVELAENAKRVGLTIERFQELRFAANVGGVSDKQFAADIEDLAKRLDEAGRKENDLTKLLDANNIKYKERGGQVIDTNKALAIAVDLISRGQNAFQQEKIAGMLGLSKEWVRAIGEAPEQFMATAASARDAGVVIDAATVEKAAQFSRDWDRASTEWSAKMRAAAAEILPSINELVDAAANFLKGIGKFDVQIIPGSIADKAVQQLEDMARNSGDTAAAAWLQRFRVGVGQGFDEAGFATGGSSPLQLTVNKGPTTKLPTSESGGSSSRDFFDRQVDSLNKRAAATMADTIAVGLNVAAHERLRAELALLQAIQRDGGEVTNTQIEKYTLLRAAMSQQEALAAAGIELNTRHAESFNAVANRVAAAAGALDDAKYKFQGVNDAAKFFGNQLVESIDRAAEGTFKFNDVLRALRQELLRALITGEGLFAKLLGFASRTGGTGGIFGLFANIFNPAGGAGVAAAAMVPAAVNVPAIPSRMMAAGQTAAGIVYETHWNVDARGTDPAAITRLERMMNDRDRTEASRVGAIIRRRDVRKTRWQ